MNLYDRLVACGMSISDAKRALDYSDAYTGDIWQLIRYLKEIFASQDAMDTPDQPAAGVGRDRIPYLSNHTGYGYRGSENFEHDDTGSQMNYSGVEDDVMNAFADHEGWEHGYDYD